VQVSGNTRAQFIIPYKAATHWLRTDKDQQFPASNIPRHIGRCNGKFTIYVVNPLTSYSPSGPNNNPVTVFTSVSFPDLQLARPSADQLCSSRGAVFVTTIPPTLEEPQVHCAGSGTAKLSETHWFGEEVTDVLQLTRRPGPIVQSRGFEFINNFLASIFTSNPRFPRPLRAEFSQNTSIGDPNGLNVNFPLWFANIFLTWRGEASYQLIPEYNGYYNSTTDSTNASDNMAVFMTNADAWQNIITPEPVGGFSPAAGYGLTMANLANGGVYKPANRTDQPSTAIVPFYTEQTFMHTPDIGIFTATPTAQSRVTQIPFNTGTTPGVSVTYMNPIHGESADLAGQLDVTLLVSTSDNFSYGGLFPPGVVTDFIKSISGPATNNLVSVAGIVMKPSAWISVVP